MQKPKGNPRKKKEVDLEACIADATKMYSSGFMPTRIKYLLYERYGLPFSQFKDIQKAVIDKIKEETDVYSQTANEMAIFRLNQLLESLIEAGDTAMVLKTLQELHKIQNLYETKLSVKNIDYKLEL